MTGARPRHMVSVGQIAAMLNARAAELAERIFPAGRRSGSEWTVADLTGAPGDNLSVCIHGAKAGVWKQFNSDDKGGDMLRLVQMALCGGDMIAAIKWARHWLGIDGADPAALQQTRRAVALRTRAPTVAADNHKRHSRAYAIMQASRPDIRGTAAEAYLAGRGLAVRSLMFPLPALRFHPELPAWNRDAPAGPFPAMVAPIYDFAGRFLGVHRTWLAPRADGSRSGGTWGKAPIDNPKKCLGRYDGGIIPLWRGLVTDADTGELTLAPPLHRLPAGAEIWIDVTEGIEDGLTVVLADPALRVVVGVALASMANIRWPAKATGICFWQQNDPERLPDGRPHPARAAFAKVVANAQAQGKRVKCARVPAHVKDVNEYRQVQLRDGGQLSAEQDRDGQRAG